MPRLIDRRTFDPAKFVLDLEDGAYDHHSPAELREALKDLCLLLLVERNQLEVLNAMTGQHISQTEALVHRLTMVVS